MVNILKGGRFTADSHSVCVGATLSINDQGKGMNRKGTKFTDDSK